MTYTYLTQKPWMARFRSHEISLAFDKAIRDMGGDIWYNTEVTKIDVKNGAVRGVELADSTYIPCERVISNLMPTVVFDRMIDKSEVPERERKLMNARKLAQSAFTVYLGLDIPYEQLGFKAYDTFVRSTGDTLSQYESAATIEGHKDYCVTIINGAIPDCTPEGTCMVQFAKFYTEDAFANVTEEEYFKLKDRIVEECVTHFEKLTGIDLRSHIEEIVVASPVTWARYLGTPQGDVYGYACGTWDGMFPRVQSGHKLDYTIKGLRFCGGHGTQMDGYSQAYLSGAEQAGIKAPSRCRSGQCGWCHSRLVSGEVFIPDEADGRREADKKFGWIHPCCTYPLSDIELDHSIFSDMMDFRRLVEMECARLACDNIYDSTYAEMEGCIDALEQGGDPEEQVYQFHYRLTQASGNGIYSMFFRAFEPVIRALIKQHYSVKAGDVQESARLHRRLLAAIKAKDEQQAVSLTREILSQGVAVLEERYGSNDGVCKR